MSLQVFSLPFQSCRQPPTQSPPIPSLIDPSWHYVIHAPPAPAMPTGTAIAHFGSRAWSVKVRPASPVRVFRMASFFAAMAPESEDGEPKGTAAGHFAQEPGAPGGATQPLRSSDAPPSPSSSHWDDDTLPLDWPWGPPPPAQHASAGGATEAPAQAGATAATPAGGSTTPGEVAPPPPPGDGAPPSGSTAPPSPAAGTPAADSTPAADGTPAADSTTAAGNTPAADSTPEAGDVPAATPRRPRPCPLSPENPGGDKSTTGKRKRRGVATPRKQQAPATCFAGHRPPHGERNTSAFYLLRDHYAQIHPAYPKLGQLQYWRLMMGCIKAQKGVTKEAAFQVAVADFPELVQEMCTTESGTASSASVGPQ